MRQFTIGLDEIACKWLEHISELSGQSIENLIASGIGNLIIDFEDDIFKTFSDSKE